jgi:hypothetical protein
MCQRGITEYEDQVGDKQGPITDVPDGRGVGSPLGDGVGKAKAQTAKIAVMIDAVYMLLAAILLLLILGPRRSE